ncbi:type II toxin-antitoxin system VapC family toxin [Ornithinicoccus hortensis]|uniref:Ribonuclease VapC n=1 Tax=Ornithinicoccus hortensis TaxID=82346 RepID=A0A542YP11_9MICO|nr:type II toxin-antitoxin system VapC family toxin [Ornithinicoccus hortensis]TQL49779.1 putative nucleic acid-binding protein [Ornithinicoccus hortensis]
MIVTDASVLVNALAGSASEVRATRQSLARDPHWVAPNHWMAEAFHALRGLALGGRLSREDAEEAITVLPTLRVTTVPIDGLLRHMWRLRDTLSGYDAAYVVLAQAQDATLLTADGRLARAAAGHCRVRLTRPPSRA